MKKQVIIAGLIFSVFMFFSADVFAAPIEWTVGSGGNGNSYESISAPNTTWTQANNLAIAAGGHLATITSAAENSFVFSLSAVSSSQYWLGGIQSATGSEPLGDWEWVTGEAWSFASWAGGEPNNSTWGDEDSLVSWGAGVWNDAPTEWSGYRNGGYVIEFESAAVPEPSTLLLLGSGLIGLVCMKKKLKS